MPATVYIKEVTGSESSPTLTLKDTSNPSRYYTADRPESNLTDYPIPIPDSGTNRSFWKSHCLDVTSGPSTHIKDIKYYQTWDSSPHDDWELGTGGDLIVGVSSNSESDWRTKTQGCPFSEYDQATGTEGTTGDPLETTHSYYSSTPGKYTSITHFSSQSSALMVQAGVAFSSGETGQSNLVVTQLIVGPGATPGLKDLKTATFVYDEA